MSARRARVARRGRSTPPTRTGMAAACAGLVLTLTPAVQARAADSGEAGVQWRSPRPSAEQHLTGTVGLRADVTTAEPVRRWSVLVPSAAGDAAFGSICAGSLRGRGQDHFRVDCRWDTARYPDQRFAPNQGYLLRLLVDAGEGERPAGPDHPVAVANPAVALSGVTLTRNDSGGETITWDPSPEPDIVRYDVEEQIEFGPWTRVGEPSANRYEHHGGAARHRFRVAAERRGPDGRTLGPGEWVVVEAGDPSDGREEQAAHTGGEDADSPPSHRRSSARWNRRRSSDRESGSEPSATTGSSDAGGRRPRRSAGTAPDDSDAATSTSTSTPTRSAATSTTGPPAGPQRADAASNPGDRTAPRKPVDPKPADHGPFSFPASSGEGFAALHAPAPIGSLGRGGGASGPVWRGSPAVPRRPRPPEPVPGAPDTGYQLSLPYPVPEVAAPATAPDNPTSAMALPDPGGAVGPGAGRRVQGAGRRVQGAGRLVQGAGLLLAAGALLVTVRRVGRHRHGPQVDRSVLHAAEAGGGGLPLEAVDLRLQQLEARLSRLEAKSLSGSGDDDVAAPTR